MARSHRTTNYTGDELQLGVSRPRRHYSGGQSLYFDLGDRELTEDERRIMLEAVTAPRSGVFTEEDFQDTVRMIGQSAGREGKSFDESLNAYWLLYVMEVDRKRWLAKIKKRGGKRGNGKNA